MTSQHSKPCIIGPSVDQSYIGGVATHIKNLSSLTCFHHAPIFDLGSAHCNHKTSTLRIILNMIKLRQKIVAGQYSHVLINSSIYLSSFVKLLLTLAFLPSGQGREIHVFFHGGDFASLPTAVTRLGKLISLRLFRKVSTFHFLTTHQRDGFDLAFPNTKSETFSNYSSSNRTLPRTRSVSEQMRILFVGRIVRTKGVFELLEAFTRLYEDEGQLVHLCFVGDGEDMLELKVRARRLPPSAVEFTGTLDSNSLEKVYAASDVLVLPSYAEAFPYVAIEAMQAGLPLIGTSVGALDTLINDGITGYKVELRDSDSIVSALRRILADPHLKDVMAQNCQQFFLDNLSLSAADDYYTKLTNVKYEQ